MKCKDVIRALSAGLLSGATSYYVIKSRPEPNPAISPLKGKLIAHRGLFNLQERPENSLPAFKAAVDDNYGIELDVQMTKDGEIVVFHDDSLLRICGVDKILTDLDYDELKDYKLINSDCTIPKFSSVLELVDGKVPLCIEIKETGDYIGTTKKVLEMLKDYKGFYCIFSFAPEVLEAVLKEDNAVLRGQLSTDYFIDKPNMDFTSKLKLSYLLENDRSMPNLVIYNYNFFDKLSYKLFRILHPDFLTSVYTVKSQAQLDEARKYFDCYIFDSFIPDK